MMRRTTLLLLAAGLAGCGGGGTTGPSTNPGAARATVRFTLRIATTRRSDLTRDQDTCARFVGPTHIHAGWRDFAIINLTAVPPDRYEATVEDVPVGIRQVVQAADQNACFDQKDGFMTHDVLANNVALTDVLATVNPNLPGPGLAFTVDRNGNVTP
jgi:hypothetical protein